MRIVYDVSPLSHPRTGVGNYVLGALRGIVEAGAHEIVAFAPASPGGRGQIERALDGLDVERALPTLPLAHPVRTAWSRLQRPPVERFLGALDVLHFSDWMFPPQRQGVRSTMVHDLVPLRFPQWTHRKTVRMHGAKYRHAAAACDVVMVNSDFTARDVEALLAVPPAQLHTAYPGVDEVFTPDGERAELDRPFILSVATLEPRKNLATLLEAYRLLGSDSLALAVVGGEGWGEQPELDAPGVERLGFLSHDELSRWYRGAAVVVYPSRFEGFGMPVVEAMASGVPVVASSHPSLDEACGDVAVRADPESAQELAAGIERALAGRDELVRRGLEHARRFTWRACGEAHLRAWRAAA
ncbi:MAG TPA: glycosyltransferase family 1 protein [Gaiellaceae bacterium]|jgi:glycosyltransferase involved in cell wall biosynthesis